MATQPAHEKDDVLKDVLKLPPPLTAFLPLSAEQERSVSAFAPLNADEPPQHAIDRVCLDLHQNPERFAVEFLRMRKQLERLADSVQGLLGREVI